MQSAEDWRTYRAKLVDIEQRQPGGQAQRSEQQRMICQPEQWAHLLSGPELGCLLLARRTEAASDSEQGVVLLVNHGMMQHQVFVASVVQSYAYC